MIKFLFAIFFSLILSSCNIEDLGPLIVSEHILLTNNQGEIIGGNTNDWKVINPIQGLKILNPPFPNPTQSSGCLMVFSSERRVSGYLKYESDEVSYISIPPSDSIRYLIRGNDFGFTNVVKKVEIIINDTLFTTGHIQFEP